MVCRSTAQVLHMEDKHNQRKELALPPGSKAYCGTVRTGLGNAYLGASVVASLVHTSKTGGMGMVSTDLRSVGWPCAVYFFVFCMLVCVCPL